MSKSSESDSEISDLNHNELKKVHPDSLGVSILFFLAVRRQENISYNSLMWCWNTLLTYQKYLNYLSDFGSAISFEHVNNVILFIYSCLYLVELTVC